jgi:nitrogen fixation protein FixH
MTAAPINRSRQLTGTKVLVAFVFFFGVVVAVNAVMLRAATSTFGGIEVASAYRAGLAFNNEIAAAARQDALQWKVDVDLARQSQDWTRLVVHLSEADGALTPGIRVSARLIHPADGRRDRRITLNETCLGEFEGTTDASPGRWDLLIEVSHDDDVVFRSRSRLTLK